MNKFLRGVSFLLLLALWSTISVTAQESEDTSTDLSVSGSRVVVDILSLLNSASETPLDLQFNATGTSAGLQALCTGESAIAGAIRPMTVEEETLCANFGVEFAEYLLGYNIMALVTHPDATFASCLTPSNIATLFAPSSQGIVTDWAQLGLETAQSVPLTLVLPSPTNKAYGLLDAQIVGTGLRTDVQTVETPSALIEQIASTPGAMGVISLADLGTESNVQLVEIFNEELSACIEPSLETAEEARYLAVDALLVYVNRANAEAFNDFLTYATNATTSELLIDAGLTPPTEETYILNQAILAGEAEAGRQFSREVTAYQIPADVAGTVTSGGAASLSAYVQSAASAFTTDYPAVTTDVTVEGTVNAIRAFCSGTMDIIFTNRPLTEEEQTLCGNNTVNPVSFNLGAQSVVLIANATPDGETDDSNSLADYPACLSREQVLNIWRSSPTAPQRWHDVDPSFPETPLVLVAPTLGFTDYTDILLTTGSGPAQPIRLDVAENVNDPAYRAAAVANVRGGLTYMSWTEYQSIAESEQANTQLVAISGDSDCVIPSQETIADLSYPYANSGQLLVSKSALSRTEVQSFIWYLFQNDNYYLYSNSGLAGVEFGDFADIREVAQTAFNEALAVTVQPPSTNNPLNITAPLTFPYPLFASTEETAITEEATAESVPEATPESTPDAELGNE